MPSQLFHVLGVQGVRSGKWFADITTTCHRPEEVDSLGRGGLPLPASVLVASWTGAYGCLRIIGRLPIDDSRGHL
jgi:hypothetical protein